MGLAVDYVHVYAAYKLEGGKTAMRGQGGGEIPPVM
jgi:hypothetical protein